MLGLTYIIHVKLLSKSVMTNPRLRNSFLRNPRETNRTNYKKYRNFLCQTFKKIEKRRIYNKLRKRDIIDQKKFCKTFKSIFSNKYNSRKNITLLVGNNIITKDEEVEEKRLKI